MWVVVSVLATAALSLTFTYLVRAGAHRLGVVAAPRKDRWHQQPTALMGGIAIYLAFVAGCFLFAPNLARAYPILVAATILFITGIVDDLFQLKPYIKLVMQVVAASITVFGGLHLPWTASALVNDVITIFWLVGITNAINLLDNMDGLAGGISLIACVFLAISFLLNGQTSEAVLTLVLAGAISGFLWFNFNPATIFMGDCGSMFLGFVLSGTALLSDFARTRNLVSVLLTPVLILMIPIFDTCMVTATRKLSGRPVSQGGRDHMSHRLVALGMSERRAVLMLYLFAAISGALALMVRQMRIEVTLALIVGLATGVAFIGWYLGKVRVYEEGEAVSGAPSGISSDISVDVVANFSHRRRAVEILLDLWLIALAYYSAYLLRFDGELDREQMPIFIKTLPLVIGIQLFCFLAGGVYRGIWRYAGVDELAGIAKSVFVGSAISGFSVLFVMYNFQGPSRAVFILNGVLLLVFVGLSRVSFQLLGALIVGRRQASPGSRPVLIYGAGDRGDMLIRELHNNPDYHYQLIGFIDDDVKKAGKLLRGYHIFNSNELPTLINLHGVSEILISSLKVPDSKLDHMRDLGVGLKRLRIQLD